MCVIISKNQGVEVPTMLELEDAWVHNPDGAGILFRRSGDKKYTICKGFMKWKIFEDFLNQMDFKKEDFVAYHFRITTSGGTSRENCHPFPVSNKNKDLKELYIQTDKAIVHNGILFHTKGAYSDTQVFTRYLAIKGLFDLTDVKKKREIKRRSKYNRLLMVENDNILYTGEWLEDEDGLMLSNDNHRYFKKYSTSKYDNWDDNWEDKWTALESKIVTVEKMVDDIIFEEEAKIDNNELCLFMDKIAPLIEDMPLLDIEMEFYDYLIELNAI
jgi:predicted glutamine amidotransferase